MKQQNTWLGAKIVSRLRPNTSIQPTLLQPLPVPESKWETISLEFITGFPKTQKQNDSIMVVIDKLSKSAHFIPVKSTFKAINIAEIFMK